MASQAEISELKGELEKFAAENIALKANTKHRTHNTAGTPSPCFHYRRP